MSKIFKTMQVHCIKSGNIFKEYLFLPHKDQIVQKLDYYKSYSFSLLSFKYFLHSQNHNVYKTLYPASFTSYYCNLSLINMCICVCI